MIKFNIKKFAILAIFSVLLSACGKDFIKYSPAKDNPVRGADRAKKNVEEGRGVTLGGLLKEVEQIMNLVPQILYGEPL